MGRTINFYHVGICRNGQKTDIDFLRFLDDIARVIWENKVRIVRENVSAIFPYHFNNLHMDKRIVPIGKFRLDYKPFVGSIQTPTLIEIQNDVVEIVTMVYDPRYRVAVIDFNVNGLRPKSIEEYFSTYLPQREGENWEVILTPVTQIRGLGDVERSTQIKGIEIKLKLQGYNRNIINRNIQQENEPHLLLDFLSDLPENTEQIEANTLKIEFGSSNGRNASINIDAAVNMLRQFNIDNDSIDSIKVRYRDDARSKLEVVDLKDVGNQLKGRILDDDPNNNPGSEYIGNTIIEHYDTYSGTLLQSYQDFINDMVGSEYPELQIIPREANKVRIDNIEENAG